MHGEKKTCRPLQVCGKGMKNFAAKVASTAASVAGKIPSPFRKQSPGNPEDEREMQEQEARWAKIKELELLCARLSHQIYSGDIQEETFEILM